MHEIAYVLGNKIPYGSMYTCKASAIAKAKQKITTHKSQGCRKSVIFHEKINSDLSFIYGPNQTQKYKYIWHFMIDSTTGLGTDRFYKSKISLIKSACQQLQKWKSEEKEVKNLQQDNSGYNKLFEERSASLDWKLSENLSILQEKPSNTTVKWKSTLQHKCDWPEQCLIIYHTNFASTMQLKLVKECLNLENKNCNIVVIEFINKQVTFYEPTGEEIPHWTKHLHLFGEARVAKISKDGKLGDHRVICIFVNYTNKHPSNCFCIINTKSRKRIETRDFQWLNKIFFQNDAIQSESSKSDSIATTKLTMKHNTNTSRMKKQH